MRKSQRWSERADAQADAAGRSFLGRFFLSLDWRSECESHKNGDRELNNLSQGVVYAAKFFFCLESGTGPALVADNRPLIENDAFDWFRILGCSVVGRVLDTLFVTRR